MFRKRKYVQKAVELACWNTLIIISDSSSISSICSTTTTTTTTTTSEVVVVGKKKHKDKFGCRASSPKEPKELVVDCVRQAAKLTVSVLLRGRSAVLVFVEIGRETTDDSVAQTHQTRRIE